MKSQLEARDVFSRVGGWLKTFAHCTTRTEGGSEVRERGEIRGPGGKVPRNSENTHASAWPSPNSFSKREAAAMV